MAADQPHRAFRANEPSRASDRMAARGRILDARSPTPSGNDGYLRIPAEDWCRHKDSARAACWRAVMANIRTTQGGEDISGDRQVAPIPPFASSTSGQVTGLDEEKGRPHAGHDRTFKAPRSESVNLLSIMRR